MPELAFLVNSELSGGFTATWKTVSSHNKSLFIRFANLGIFDKGTIEPGYKSLFGDFANCGIFPK